MKKLLLASLISALILWAWNFYIGRHMVPLKSFANPELTAIGLHTQVSESGVYVYPSPTPQISSVNSKIEAARVYCIVNTCLNLSELQEVAVFLSMFCMSFCMGWMFSLLKHSSFLNRIFISGTIGIMTGLYRLFIELQWWSPPFFHMMVLLSHSILSLLIVGSILSLFSEKQSN